MGAARVLVNTAIRHLGRFSADRGASTFTTLALALPVLVAAVGGAIDYGVAASTRTKMQATADSAAVAGARALALAQATPSSVTAVVTNVINATLSGATSSVNVDTQARTVQVLINKQYTPVTRILLPTGNIPLNVSATAALSGSLPLCVLGLDPAAPQTVGLEANAMMTATGCLVQSNSSSKIGLQALNGAVLHAGLICSVGGKVSTTNANFSPPPTTDCPVVPDPLASRSPPPAGSCNYTAKIVDGVNVTLQPGTYCAGLTVTNGASVKLAPGTYIVSGGPLIVDRGSSFSGTDVSFYLTGAAANVIRCRLHHQPRCRSQRPACWHLDL
jgi:Flp pilus assembly protein TadG